MAVTSKDGDDPPRYYGGWRPIAAALALGGSERTMIKSVGKIVATLLDVGVIAVDKRPTPVMPTVYRLVLTVPHGGGVSDVEESPVTGDCLDADLDGNGPPLLHQRSPLTAPTVPRGGGPEEEEEEEEGERRSRPPASLNAVAPTTNQGGLDENVPSTSTSRPACEGEVHNLDQAPVETSPTVMHVYLEVGERYALLRMTEGGTAWLETHGVPTTSWRTRRGRSVRAERLPDLVTMARWEGWTVYEHDTAPTAETAS